MVKEKRVEVNAFSIMSNHIHLIWQIQDGYFREDIQRAFVIQFMMTHKHYWAMLYHSIFYNGCIG